jgi:hypothetical protein
VKNPEKGESNSKITKIADAIDYVRLYPARLAR